MTNTKWMVALLASVMASVGWAADPPEVDKDGLHLVHNSDLRVVYTRPGVDFGQFDKVILVDAYVAFRKNWRRDEKQRCGSVQGQQARCRADQEARWR